MHLNPRTVKKSSKIQHLNAVKRLKYVIFDFYTYTYTGLPYIDNLGDVAAHVKDCNKVTALGQLGLGPNK